MVSSPSYQVTGDDQYVPVSVIIPCYCCVETIGRAFQSVLNQTRLPKQVILVDDASDDDGKTLAVLNTLAIQYAGIFEVTVKVLSENLGAANARNVGWSLASQPYLALLDSDDAWHPKKIEIQYNFMKNQPNLALTGHGFKITAINQQPNWSLGDFSFKLISKMKLLASNQFVTPSVMIRTEISVRFNSNKRYVDDHLLWLNLICNGFELAKIELPLVLIYKPMYGASGLSAALWLMEKSELDNFKILFRENHINLFVFSLLTIYSFLKYCRRVLIVFVTQLVKWLKCKCDFFIL